MTVKHIPLINIFLQKSIANRGEEEVATSESFLELMASIRSTKGLLQPIVVREGKDNRYELFVGHRRFLAHEGLVRLGEGSFEKILACVFSKDTSSEEMLTKTIHENTFRTDPSALQAIESRISLVPYYLDCGVDGKAEENKQLGFNILKIFNSYVRTKKSKVDHIEKLTLLTGHANPILPLKEFFESIGESSVNFYRKAKVLFEYDEEVIQLYTDGRVNEKHASKIQKIEDKKKKALLVKTLNSKNHSHRKIDELILEIESPPFLESTLINAIDDIKKIIPSHLQEKAETHLEKLKKLLKEET